MLWTVTDNAGNTNTCEQLVTVEDNEDPIITCPSDVVVDTDAGLCTASGVNLGSELTSDNCGISSVVNNSSEPYALGQTTVLWTVTDNAGNTNTCEQLVTVEDNEDPIITCPSDVVVDTDAGLCTASGVNLGSELTNDNCGVASVVNNASEPYALGQTTIIWTVTDNSGNTNTCEQLVTVEDNEDPGITCPSDVVVDTDAGLCTASGVNLGSELTSDNCGVASVVNNSSEPYALGQTTVLWTVTDNAGNTNTCEQLVTVEDNEDPGITCPADVLVDTDAGLCTASGVNLGSELTSDNCGVASVVNNSSEPYSLGQTTVLWTVTDNAGNTNTCEQLVTVEDNEDPIITCPSDVLVDTDAGLCTASGVNLGSELTSDNCGISSVVNNSSEPYALGQTIVLWTVTDNAGNTNTCEQLVTVEDNEDPIITCPSDVLVDTDAGLCTASGVNLGSELTSDNCGISSVVNNASEPYALGQTTILWTVTDNAGNTNTCEQLVTVEDNEDPSITCPSDVLVDTDAGLCTASGVNLGSELTSDNCGIASVVNNASEPYALGQTTIIWTVTDNSGNTNTCEQLVTVEDNEDPGITCPSDVVVDTDAGLCTASGVNLGSELTNDNCGVASVVNNASEPYALGQTTIIWTVTDNAGNTNTCEQLVTVEDNEDPIITCPSDVVVDTDAGLCTASGVTLGSELTSDNCGVASVVNNSSEPYALGQTTVLWTVTDNAGNTNTCEQLVTVEDNEDPIITCPSDVVVDTDAGLCTASGVNLGSELTNDNCGVASVVNNASEPYALGQTTIIWTVTDNAGNTNTCEQLVTVEDNEDPGITCPSDVVVDTDAGLCTASGVNLGSELTSDNCGVASVVNNSSEPYALGQTTVLWTVTDNAGNTNTCEQLVTVEDNEDPGITCPADVLVDTDAGLCTASGVNLGSELTSDNCGVASVVNNSSEPYALGQTTVLWTVTDNAGNTNTCEQLVTVEDNEDPGITCPSDVVVDTDAGLCTASGVTLGSELTSDNCGVASVINNSSEPYALGQTTVLWTVTDNAGNTNTCEQLVTVEDNEDPIITCPSDVVVDTDASLCTASGVTLGSELTSDNCGVASVVNNSSEPYALGQTTVLWTVTDNAGNTNTCEQLVTVEDNEDPIITCPSDVVVDTDAGLCTASGVNLGSELTSDNCGVASVVNNSSEPYALGQTTVLWTVTDNSGNTNTCEQLVTVEDNEDPGITCPSDVVVDTDAGLCTASGVNLGSEFTSDNCGVASVVNNASEPYSLGQTTVLWTVTDNAGNTNTCEQLVTVEDNEDPIITCPSDVVVDTDAGLCTASGVNLGSELTSDNCGISSVVNNSSEPYSLGQTTVLWTVTDNAGNTNTCEQLVTVEDNEDPIITCPSDVVVDTDAGLCTASGVNLGSELTSDNCGISSVVNNSSEPYSLGQTTVLWTVTDNAGNTNTCEQLVTVEDNEDPIITCPSDVVVDTDAGLCTASGVNLGSELTSDNCGISSVVNNSSEPYSLGQTTVLWTVTDNAGNTNTCEQLVTVEDNEDPGITCPSDVLVDTDAGLCTASGVNLGSEITSDNCGVASVVNNSSEPYSLGQTTVLWTVTDNSGNTNTCEQLVTVEDNEDPIITCPSDVVVDTDAGLCTASGVNLGSELTSDNCGVASVVNNSSEPYSLGQTTVLWTVTDNSGNTNTCEQLVTVEDNEDPGITCPSDVVVDTDAGLCTASGVNLGSELTSDNCGVSSVVNNSSEPFSLGQTTVLWTVTDNSGNTNTCEQLITVMEDEDPMITCPSDITVSTDVGICTASGVDLGMLISSDNCGVVSETNDGVEPYGLGTTTVIWTVSDGAGNTATCEQDVTVEDTELPMITCPSDITVSANPGECEVSGINLGTALTSDNCSIQSEGHDGTNPYGSGQTIVIWTVVDGSGNSNTCEQIVQVDTDDTEDPDDYLSIRYYSEYRCRHMYSQRC